MKTIAEIKRIIETHAATIHAPARLLPEFEHSDRVDPRVIFLEGGEYHYRCITERGAEAFHLATKDIDELLYEVFKPITFEMAGEYELHNRIPDKDPRRIIFDKQIKLLAQVNKDYAYKCYCEQQETLSRSPYNDNQRVDEAAVLRVRAMQHFQNRDLLRTTIREADGAASLGPNYTWEEVLAKYTARGYLGDDIFRRIIAEAITFNYGIEEVFRTPTGKNGNRFLKVIPESFINPDGTAEVYFENLLRREYFQIIIDKLRDEGIQVLHDENYISDRRVELRHDGHAFFAIQDYMFGNYLFTKDKNDLWLVIKIATRIAHRINNQVTWSLVWQANHGILLCANKPRTINRRVKRAKDSST
ncbi:MAG: immunity 63 family protein [Clostridiales Family XIII bacterium]|jgi:hypothetical protein|nr:immunity 63 family protein [Clostridiales Family XIII bacterium]